jgi:hypothetical protein
MGNLVVLELLGLSNLFTLLFVFHLLLVNFSVVVFTSECRLIKRNHLNFSVLYD